MAYLISDNLCDPWGLTAVEFMPGAQDVEAFFKRTHANPFTITNAGWRTGTRIRLN